MSCDDWTLQQLESLRREYNWVRDILAEHGYDGPLGDGCCPLREWLLDAARYRWLREQWWFDRKVAVAEPKYVKLGTQCYSHDMLDQFIDERMNKP